MKRIRFRSTASDWRPINWPVKHPFWCSGYGDGHAIIISYADDKQYIYDNWPEATHLEVEERESYIFTSRFPKPEWLEDGDVSER